MAVVDTEVAEEEASGVVEEELGKSEPTIFRARVPSEVERRSVCVIGNYLGISLSIEPSITSKAIKRIYSKKELNKRK